MKQADLGDVESQEKDLPPVEDNEDTFDEETAEDADGSAASEEGDEKAPTEADPEAQRKEIQERLEEEDLEATQVRASLKEDWEDIEAAHEHLKTQIKNPIKTTTGEIVYLLPQDEFEALEDYIIEQGDPAKLAQLKQARLERREYLKKCQDLAPEFQKVQQDVTKRTMADIERIKSALIEITPEYEQHFGEIEEVLTEEFKRHPAKLERFRWGNIRDKYRFIDRLLDSSGIKQRVEKEIRTKERPNLAAPVGAGKGKRGTPAGKSSSREFTRSQIDKMSLAEYERNEKAIDKALLEGRIK